jgi:hypothetical protein
LNFISLVTFRFPSHFPMFKPLEICLMGKILFQLHAAMCFPQVAACERRRSSGAARVVEEATWRRLLPPRLLKESRKSLSRLRDWGRSRVQGAGHTVNLMSDWVSKIFLFCYHGGIQRDWTAHWSEICLFSPCKVNKS